RQLEEQVAMASSGRMKRLATEDASPLRVAPLEVLHEVVDPLVDPRCQPDISAQRPDLAPQRPLVLGQRGIVDLEELPLGVAGQDDPPDALLGATDGLGDG